MANEPSWEDIFRPDPTPAEPTPARQVPDPLPESDPFADLFQDAVRDPEPQYPPTAVQPVMAPEPAAAAPEPAFDPFAELFRAEVPIEVHEAAPSETGIAAPFPGLFGAPSAAQPAEPTSPSLASPSDDPFADLFGSATPTASSAPDYRAPLAFPSGTVDAVPLSRREAREAEGRRRPSAGDSGGRGGDGGGRGGDGGGTGSDRPKKKRSLLWLKITLPIVLVLGAVGGVAAYGWFNYNEQVRALLGIPLPTDYEGTGNGEEVVVAVRTGDLGSDVAVALHEAGVTMTYDAVYDYLVDNPDISFTPGNWRLQKEMSAVSAVAALQDDANKVTDKLLLREGISLASALELISETLNVPLEEVQAAAADPSVYGLPAQATTLEGFLFPATYELDGTETPQQVLQKLVDTMFEHLDAAKVPVDNRFDIVIMASIIQREAGQNTDDFYKISRVFQNRIDQDMNLESDATVAYGTGRFDSVWTTPDERADASNLYNTYANSGLPIGPIGLAGDQAIDAALHPADGSWLYFVPVNLATGETVFSDTLEEHEAASEQLFAWCEASPENATYCE